MLAEPLVNAHRVKLLLNMSVMRQATQCIRSLDAAPAVPWRSSAGQDGRRLLAREDLPTLAQAASKGGVSTATWALMLVWKGPLRRKC